MKKYGVDNALVQLTESLNKLGFVTGVVVGDNNNFLHAAGYGWFYDTFNGLVELGIGECPGLSDGCLDVVTLSRQYVDSDLVVWTV